MIYKIIMNDLMKNIDEIHTTALGIIRIKKNLELETDDVVEWCKKKTKDADNIVKEGKNWYVYAGDSVITINSYSYTIITAHKYHPPVNQFT
jgi:intein-encoded DNA endonuclease-like protein